MTVFHVEVRFFWRSTECKDFEEKLLALDIPRREIVKKRRNSVVVRLENSPLDERFRDEIAATLKCFIEKITPVVDEFANELNEEG